MRSSYFNLIVLQLDTTTKKIHPSAKLFLSAELCKFTEQFNYLNGCDYLKQIGYPADRSSTQELIKTMFHLRGLERFWNTYQQYLDSADGPTSGSDINYTDYFLF